jgi:3,4-dihydroxy 2-butanone 4-phosphate synthase/GTP cyclohydrolase II
VFPLRYHPGGALVRPGHTEAAVDLARLAGLVPAGVLCEVVNEDGTMSRGATLEAFSEEHGIPIVTIEDLISYRWKTEALVTRESEAQLPTAIADFRAIGYRAKDTGSEHIALVLGDVEGRSDVLTRLHSVCLTGDVFGSLRCDCGVQLRVAMEMIAEAGEGIIVYNPTHEGRGTGLVDKLAAYRLQEQGYDTAEANVQVGHPVDARHYGVDAQILHELKVTSVRLLTNNPEKIEQVKMYGVDVSERIPLWVGQNEYNRFYLATKEAKLGHLGV